MRQTYFRITPAREPLMRLSLALITLLATILCTAESDAGNCFRGPTTVPYAATYAPSYAARYAPVATTPYVAGYAAVPATSTVVTARRAWNTAPVVTNGPYQAQRPSYYDNPSVYTGLPVTRNVQTSYSVPYQSAYVSASPGTVSPGMPVTTATTVGPPVAAYPAPPIPVAPVIVPPPARKCCLSRFCDWMRGTNYQTTYYRAPVTYYRPVTTIDPVAGTTLTVQQPCTSYVQQLQRTPYVGLQAGQPAAAQPSNGCQTTGPGGCQTTGPGGYSVSPFTQPVPTTAAPTPYTGAIGQVGAVGSPGQFTVPIPSTVPTGGYGGSPGYSPNGTPLIGAPPMTVAPPTTAPPVSSASPTSGDRSPVDQPSLQNYRPSERNPSGSQPKPSKPSNEPPASYWKLQGPEDSMAMIRPTAPRQATTARDPVSVSTGAFTGVDPIAAPDDYVSPFRQRIEAPTTPATQQPLAIPPLPPQSFDRSDVTSVSNRSSVSAREAALVRARVSRQSVPQKRDSTWYTLQP